MHKRFAVQDHAVFLLVHEDVWHVVHTDMVGLGMVPHDVDHSDFAEY